KRLTEHLHHRHGGAHRSFEAQLDTGSRRDREEIGAVPRNQLLVGRNHRLTSAQELLHIAARRLEPTHDLGYDVDAGVIAQHGEIVGEHAFVRREVALLSRIADERAYDRQPVSGCALDLVAALREHPSNGRADRAVTEETYADVNRSHSVSTTLSARAWSRPTFCGAGKGRRRTKVLVVLDLGPAWN